MSPAYWMGLLGALTASPVAGQSSSLQKTADQAREAWAGHQIGRLILGSDSVLIQLPGARPSVPVTREQAAALLRDFFRGSEEVQTDLGRVRRSGSGKALIEILRQYRISGTLETRRLSALLGYALVGGTWRLSEVRVSP